MWKLMYKEHYIFLTMEVVKRVKDNCQKQTWIRNYTFQLESHKKRAWSNNIYYTLFLISMLYFLLSLSMLRKRPFSVSKYAKDMQAYGKGTPYCFLQQTTAYHEYGINCCSMEIFHGLTCQKHMKSFEACIFPLKYFC